MSRPTATDLLETPGALLTRTHLRELGFERRAVDAVFRELPVVALPGYSRAARLEHVPRRSSQAVTRRIRAAIIRARGTWAIRETHPRDAGSLLCEGWEPYGASPGRVYLRRRHRDWSAAVLLVFVALAVIVAARWLIVLFLAWLVVA